jgi:hypothetical protein
MAFPTSPVNGQIYKEYTFDSSLGLWRKNVLVSGAVRQTELPSFSGVGCPNGTHTAYSGQAYIPGAALYNQGNHFNMSNGRFTCPVSGLYLVTFNSLMYTNWASEGHAYIWIAVNGSQRTQHLHSMYNISRKYEWMSGVFTVSAQKGQYITCQVGTPSGGTLWGSTSTPYTSLSISLLH